MSSERLRARVPQVRALGPARLSDWRLCFDKHGRDGTAKANIRPASGDEVWGVLFEFHEDHRAPLDEAESLGVGYRRRWVEVRQPGATWVTAFTYTALLVREGLGVQEWYLQHLLRGSSEHGLPPRYAQRIRRLALRADRLAR
jgi:hypothetical protein